ncbi:MAG: FixH family protein [Gemmatimonadaceae bacterium]|jgi:hypothetical protein|nr:FixH family protein [Gemmatimonadaceae bacterium]
MDAGTRWKAGVVGSLVGVVGLYVVLIRIAADPAALAHDERYYQHAINHDAEQAIVQRNARLGWKVSLDATPLDAPGPGRITARVTDAAGAPITGATVRLTGFHLAHADAVVTTRATAGDDGYVASVDPLRPGLWELEVEVYRGTDRLRTTERLDVGRRTVATR